MSEILSPCGSPESITAAIGCGCSAVYLGAKEFSARQNASNFTPQELSAAIRECHRNSVKIYQAINTLVFDSQLSDIAHELEAACSMGVDGIIVQDLAVAALARLLCPDLPIHASTQMSIHTPSGVLLCRELGFRRVVAARELPLKSLRTLCDTGIDIEAFVHGALCMSVSGQCYMSALIGSRSANRGLCAQACRLPFSALKSADERHDLSLKDMSHIQSIKGLEEAGVKSFKIEGRMKRPEYVAAATTACRKALDGEAYDEDILRAVFSRSGFTDGYISGRLGSQMFGTRERDDVISAKEALPKLRELYRKPYKRFTIDFALTISATQPVTLHARSSDGLSVTVSCGIPQTAENRCTTSDEMTKQLSKLGSTIYNAGKISCCIEDDLYVSAAEINSLRRQAVERLDELRTEGNTPKHSFMPYTKPPAHRRTVRKQKIHLDLSYASQLDGPELSDIALVSLPLPEAEKLGTIPEKLSVSLPRFDFDENKTLIRLKRLAERGLKHVTATNLAHFRLCRDLNTEIHAGFGLNITNSLAAQELERLGAKDITASFELTSKQLACLDTSAPLGAIAYGKLPAMLTVNCPIKQATDRCDKCTHCLTDRTGRSFDVKCSGSYVEILNSDTLWLADKLSDFSTLDFFTLMFYNETPDRIREVINAYKNGLPPQTVTITRGLYYRGIT